MLKRALFGTVLLAALGTSAMAAIPAADAPPAKPSLNRASPMIYDPATTIHGKAPVSKPAPGQDTQAALPDKQKPVLYRASPMLDDRLMGTPVHGAPPVLNDQLIRGKAPH